MEKLKIYYLEEQENSSFGFVFKTKTPKLYIGTKETKLIAELKEELEEDLRKRNLLGVNEFLELEEFDDTLMCGEKENGRMDKDVYRVLNNMNAEVKAGRTTWEEISKEINQSREESVQNVHN